MSSVLANSCLFFFLEIPGSPVEGNSSARVKNELHITEETEDAVFAQSPTPHTTEDLFTIIHRYDQRHKSQASTLVYVCIHVQTL